MAQTWIMNVTAEEHALAKAVRGRATGERTDGTYDHEILYEGMKQIFGAETTDLWLKRRAKMVERPAAPTIPPGERFVEEG